MFNQKKVLTNLTHLKLFYEGNHNKTYKGFFCDEVVQVRVAQNTIVNHKNEILFLKNYNNTLYIDNSIMVRKWIPGNHLEKNDITTLKIIEKVLSKHWSIQINNISFFDNNLDVNDLVLSHGDLRPKNIIINKGEAILIDFEWINYNSKYFDLSHLHLYCFFSIQDIVEVFNVDKDKLIKAIDDVTKFNERWEKKVYKKNLINRF